MQMSDLDFFGGVGFWVGFLVFFFFFNFKYKLCFTFLMNKAYILKSCEPLKLKLQDRLLGVVFLFKLYSKRDFFL